MANLRLALVMTTLGVGGAEGQFVQLALALRRRGYDVEVVCLHDETAAADTLRAAGIRVDTGRAGSGPPLRRALRLVRCACQTVWRWRRCQPDVVHGVLLHGYVFAGLAARLAGVRIFVSSRRSLGMFKDAHPILRRAEAWVNRRTTLVVANSEAVREDTLRREHLPPARVEVIHNGLSSRPPSADARTRVRTELSVPATAPVGITVANLIHYKAHDVLLAGWTHVAARIPEARLWLVGEGPERPRLTRAIAQAGLDDRVVLLGSRRDVADLLAAADLLVHPSREEGFSNALLEAMAAGLPIVATDVGGNAEAVVAGLTGTLVPPDDPTALGAAVIDVLTQPDRGAAMGEAGRQRVVACFGDDRMVQAYDDLYRRLVRQEGHGHRACVA